MTDLAKQSQFFQDVAKTKGIDEVVTFYISPNYLGSCYRRKLQPIPI